MHKIITFSVSNLRFLFLILYRSGRVPWVASVHMRQGCVISDRTRRRITGFSHSTSVTSRPEKYWLISVPVLLNADCLKILAVTNSKLTFITMREMEGMMQQREPPETINSYDVFSNQMDFHNEHTECPSPSPPQATLMDSTLELETLVLVLTFNAFRFTTGLLPAELMVLSCTQK